MGATPVGQLDKQLEALLARLRAADGDPVSFDELRSQRIENPALLAYELEVAGIQVGRVPRAGEISSRPTALKLERDPAQDTQPMATTELPDHPLARLRAGLDSTRLLLSDTREEAVELSTRAAAALRELKPARSHSRGTVPTPPEASRRRIAWQGQDPKRVAAIAALAVVCLAALALVLANLPGSAAKSGAPIARNSVHRAKLRSALPARAQVGAPPASSPTTSAAPPSPTRSQTESATPPPSTTSSQTQKPAQPASAPAQNASATAAADSPQAAAALEEHGHQLVAEGQFPQAISELRAALAATGQSVARCAEPSGEACLTYAYALYDLGHALRLDGQTASALAVLGERLQIDNQRPVVEAEIALARGTTAGSGGGAQAGPPPTEHPAKRRAHEGRRRKRHDRRLRRTGGAPSSG